MDGEEKDNANPTVLDVSELPERRKRRRPRNSNSIYRDILKTKSTLEPSGASDTSGPDSEDDLSDEPIDEQEIYGLSTVSFSDLLIQTSRSHRHALVYQKLSLAVETHISAFLRRLLGSMFP